MRILVLIALCLAVASATTTYGNRNRFNRLLRQIQRQQQQQEQGYQPQGYLNDEDYDSDEQDDEDYYQQQQQQQQCRRNQGYGCDQDDQDDQYGIDEQDEYDQDQQDEYGQSTRTQQRRQQQSRQQQRGQQQRGQQQRGQQQRKRQQQQQHQCSPRFQLLQTLEEANSQLASKLYKQAKQESDDKNTVVSPTAIQLALAAIKRGARGNTQRQIQRVLGAGLSNQQTHQAHAALQESLQGQDPLQQQTGQSQKAQVKTTTTIVLNQRNHAQQKFIKAVLACANAQVKKCDFQRQPQQCRKQINRYVAQKTNNKLQQAVPQDAVTSNTQLLVVSTAQVKAGWGRQFRQQQITKQGKFHPLGNQQPKNVQVLQSQGQFNYYEDEQLQVVGVPTQQQELTVYVIVPKDKDGLNQIEKQQIQNGQQLKQLLDQADQQQEDVDLELPKIQIKHKIDAKQALLKEGIQDAFDGEEADFSGINGQQQGQQQRRRRQQDQDNDEEDQDQQDQYDQQQRQKQQLHVNKLIHQATIKIDEQGIHSVNSNQNQQGQYDQQGQDDEDEDEDEQAQHYRQQQQDRQELFDEIFGQRQGQGQGQRRQNRRRHQGQQGEKKVKANRAFAIAIKHNASNQIVLIGRVVDAAQKPNQQQGRQQGQSLNGVDQQ